MFRDNVGRMEQFGVLEGMYGNCDSAKSITYGAKVTSYKRAIEQLIAANDKTDWKSL